LLPVSGPSARSENASTHCERLLIFCSWRTERRGTGDGRNREAENRIE
jgi:hypothetical protein